MVSLPPSQSSTHLKVLGNPCHQFKAGFLGVSVGKAHQRLVAVFLDGRCLGARLGSGTGLPELSRWWVQEAREGRFCPRYQGYVVDLGVGDGVLEECRRKGRENLAPLRQEFFRRASDRNRTKDKLSLFLRSLLPGKLWVGTAMTESGQEHVRDLLKRSSEGSGVWLDDHDLSVVVVYVP